MVVADTLNSLLAEPRPTGAPARRWYDWALVAIIIPTAIVEGLLRTELTWRPLSIVVAAGLSLCLLIRRQQPLTATALTFGTLAVLDAVAIATGVYWPGQYVMFYVLVIPFALGRWGSGREIAIGSGLMALTFALSVPNEQGGVGEAIAGGAFLFSPMILGLEVRHLTRARARELDQVKLQEREQLARDLHDTVGHHVSAIAVQAQAARAVGGTRPEAALDALAVIEEAASRTLTEMRTIVRALRDGDDADLAPQQQLADLGRLAAPAGRSGEPAVDVVLEGDLDDLGPSLQTTLYRIAQESITNATRHAREATRIVVKVIGESDGVRLTVRDDGKLAQPHSGTTPGFGLVGMAERVALIGGTLAAGPGDAGGWAVEANFPKAAVDS